MSSRLRLCGAMSGSSMDGLDMAICSFEQLENGSISWELEDFQHAHFSANLIAQLKSITEVPIHDYCRTEQSYTNFCSEHIGHFIKRQSVDAIAIHGHTVFHSPSVGRSVQLGNSQLLAQSLNHKVIAEFRDKDISLGGQGAPLAPVVEHYLFDSHKCFLNLGGIANISFHQENSITAFDVTACNQPLNFLSQKYFGQQFDKDGKIAQSGNFSQDLFDGLGNIEFLKLPPPKSISNRWVRKDFIQFVESFAIPPNDKLHTIVKHISRKVRDCCLQFSGSGEIFITGGGAKNSFLMKSLNEDLKSTKTSVTIPDVNIVDYKEAILMALLGYLRIKEIPNSFASVTGAMRDNCNGTIYQYF